MQTDIIVLLNRKKIPSNMLNVTYKVSFHLAYKIYWGLMIVHSFKDEFYSILYVC